MSIGGREWDSTAAWKCRERRHFTIQSSEDTPARTPLTPALAEAPPAVVDTRGEWLTKSEPSVELRTWLPPRILAPKGHTQPRSAPNPARCRPNLLRGFLPPAVCAALRLQNAELDEDIALIVGRCVGDEIDRQIEAIGRVIERLPGA